MGSRSSAVESPQGRMLRTAALLILTLCVTLILQQYVGLASVYRSDLEARQTEVLERLINNDPPASGKWGDLGLSSANIRIASLWIIVAIKKLTGVGTQAAMRLLDTVCLWIFLSVLVPYLRFWFRRSTALLGLAYVVAVAPLSYFLFYFHPWDRLAALCWILSYWLVRRGDWRVLGVILPFLVMVKYDIALVAGLYWLVWIGRTSPVSVTVRSAVLALSGFGTYILLLSMYPSSDTFASRSAMFLVNIRAPFEDPMSYQPALAYLPLVVPIWLGLGRADQFVRASAAFAACFMLLALVTVNFIEMRAQMPILLALLPCALLGVERILNNDATPTRTVSNAQQVPPT